MADKPAAVDPDALRVKFIPVSDGDLIIDPRHVVTGGWDKGKRSTTGVNQIIGFKPGRAGKREGHLVVLIRDHVSNTRKMRKLRPQG